VNSTIKSISVSQRITIFTIVILATSVLALTSCVTYDSEQEGIVGSVYNVEDVKVLLDPASDRLLAFALRNDSTRQVKVDVRAIGGEIGYNTSSASGFAGKSSGNYHRAGYLVSPNDIVLNPGDEAMGKIFLKNWYQANKNFKSRFEFNVYVEEERHMVMISANQDDIFSDADDMFQQNRLGKNDPTRYGSRHYNVDQLPDDYSLSIPE
jgi:hypothetical protein